LAQCNGQPINELLRDAGNPVLKDIDFMRLGRAVRLYWPHEGESPLTHRLRTQLRKDIAFLREHDIMDHSILLGIHHATANTPDEEEEVCIRGSPQAILEAYEQAYCLSLDTAVSKGLLGKSMEDHGRSDELCRYSLGIIDILQSWDFNKVIEHAIKTKLLRLDEDAISCVRPRRYEERMSDFINVRVLPRGQERQSASEDPDLKAAVEELHTMEPLKFRQRRIEILKELEQGKYAGFPQFRQSSGVAGGSREPLHRHRFHSTGCLEGWGRSGDVPSIFSGPCIQSNSATILVAPVSGEPIPRASGRLQRLRQWLYEHDLADFEKGFIETLQQRSVDDLKHVQEQELVDTLHMAAPKRRRFLSEARKIPSSPMQQLQDSRRDSLSPFGSPMQQLQDSRRDSLSPFGGPPDLGEGLQVLLPPAEDTKHLAESLGSGSE